MSQAIYYSTEKLTNTEPTKGDDYTAHTQANELCPLCGEYMCACTCVQVHVKTRGQP